MVGPLINDQSLAGIRSVFERNLTDTCVIKRLSGQTASALGYDETRVELPAVPCSYAPPGRSNAGQSNSESIVAGGVEVSVLGLVKLQANTVVEQSDQMRITIAETGEELNLEVAVVLPKSREFLRKVYVRLVDQGEA